MKQRNRVLLACAAIALMVSPVASKMQAQVSIAMETSSDIAPQKMEAAVDLGLIAVSVLITWSRQLSY